MKDLKFSRDSIELLKKAKEKSLSKAEEESYNALSEASKTLSLGDPYMVESWLSPIIDRAKKEEDLVQFFKLLLTYSRASIRKKELQKEVAALEILLDDRGPLALASVNFDDMEIYEKDRV